MKLQLCAALSIALLSFNGLATESDDYLAYVLSIEDQKVREELLKQLEAQPIYSQQAPQDQTNKESGVGKGNDPTP